MKSSILLRSYLGFFFSVSLCGADGADDGCGLGKSVLDCCVCGCVCVVCCADCSAAGSVLVGSFVDWAFEESGDILAGDFSTSDSFATTDVETAASGTISTWVLGSVDSGGDDATLSDSGDGEVGAICGDVVSMAEMIRNMTHANL